MHNLILSQESQPVDFHKHGWSNKTEKNKVEIYSVSF